MINKPTKIQLSKIPKLYAQENEKDPKVYMKFFLGSWTWYVTEFDGKDIMFGWVIDDSYQDGAELGYISLKELMNLKPNRFLEVDRELHGITPYSPMKLSEAKKMHFKIRGQDVASDEGANDFYRDSDDKIDNTRLSAYGKRELTKYNGQRLHYTKQTLLIDGNKLIDIKTKKVIDVVDSDRKVNRIIFKLF